MNATTAKVESYATRTTTGGRVCGTLVRFADGVEVRFICRMGKREAIRQAEVYRLREGK